MRCSIPFYIKLFILLYKMCTVTRPNLLADCQLSVVRPRKIGTNQPLQWVVVDEWIEPKNMFCMTTKKRPGHYSSECFFKLTKSFNHRQYLWAKDFCEYHLLTQLYTFCGTVRAGDRPEPYLP